MSIVNSLRQTIDNARPRNLMLGEVVTISSNSARVLLSDGSMAPFVRIVKGLR